MFSATTDSYSSALDRAALSFLDDSAPVAGYAHRTEGLNRMLIEQETGQPVLLTRADGAVYLERSVSEKPEGRGLRETLRRRGMRPTDTTLTLRIGDAVFHFSLWASPRYRAASAEGGGDVWK